MRLAGAGSADQDYVALLSDESGAGKIAHQMLINRRVFERKVIDIFGKWHLGDGELISDRTRLLLRYFGLQQIADELLRLVSRLSAVASVSS